MSRFCSWVAESGSLALDIGIVKSTRVVKHRFGLLITTDLLAPFFLFENDQCPKHSAPE
jgi:hypothetical protein